MKTLLNFKNNRNLLSLFCTLSTAFSIAQTTVFNDDFTTSSGTTYTTVTGTIGNSTKWNMSRSGNDFGAKITSGMMTLVNDASTSTNANGWVLGYTNIASNFSAPYSSILSANPGLVTWSFNMRQIRTNPGGFASDKYGVAYILAGTSGTTNTVGTGYAIVLGNSDTTDPIKLVRYTAGIRTFTTLLTSNTTGLKDFGAEYISVKVTYTPATNTWQLSLRNDGTTAFTDPLTNTLTSQGTVVNSTYTASSLPIMGFYWNASTSVTQTAFLDNVNVSVVVPSITSISPSSKVANTGAFTLTVTGSNFVSGTSTIKWNGSARTTTFVSATQLTAAILASDITSAGNANISVSNGTGASNVVVFGIDAPSIPALSVSTNSLSNFSTTSGTASSATTYSISGSDLTADVVVTAPSNFEISTQGTTYSNSVTLTRSGTTLVSQPITLYVRVKSAASAGIISGTITHTSTGATTKNVSVSATVLATQPSTTSSNVTFTGVTSESFTVNWTNGTGSNHLVLIKSGSAVNATPIDAVTYTAMPTYGTGSELGTGNFTLYKGTNNSVTVTGLTAATTYYIAVFDYNGSAATENYISSATTGNRTTLNAPIGWQIYATNTVNTIDFDNTVDGVNENAYLGDGFAPTSATGLLNSNAWAVSGFTDGAIAFGGTSTEGLDFDRGISSGNTTVGGIYSFETAPNNYSLGIHPSTGDFAPGAVTLRFQNQSGSTITSLNIGYKVYVYNGQNAANSFNFSHSADNTTYTSVAGINTSTPTTAEVSLGWTAYYRVVTLTGLNITNNNYYYMKWSGATVSGSTQFDDISLDDISIVANPTTEFVSFEGNARSFVVQGNTSLSNATTVSQNLTINSGKVALKGATLTLGGTVTNAVTGGLTGGGNSSLVLNGNADITLSLDQTTPGTTNVVNNVTINTNNTNIITLDNPIICNGNLTTALDQTLDLGTNALTGSLTSITNNGTIATQNTSETPLPPGKSWGGNGTVLYNNANSTQSIVAGTYHGLTINNTDGGVALGNITVNGIMHLPNANPSATSGSLDMGIYTLTLGLSATNTGQGDVTGTITRNNPLANIVYTFGNPVTTYALTGSGETPTYITIKTTIGTPSCCEDPEPNPAPILRYYEINLPITSPGLYSSVNLHYLDSELNGNIENDITTGDYDIPTPEELGGSGKGSPTHDEHGRAQYDITSAGAKYIGWANVPINYFMYIPGQSGDPGFPHDWRTIFSLYTHSNSAYKTWTGLTNSDWNSGSNWFPDGAVDATSRILIPDASTLTNLPILPSGNLTFQSITIGDGIPLTASGNITITATGAMGGGAWEDISGGFNPNGYKVIFTGFGATISGNSQFYDVEIGNNASIINMADNVMKINHSLIKIGSGKWYPALYDSTIDYNGENQSVLITDSPYSYYNLKLSGSGIKTLPSSTITVEGNLTFSDITSTTANSDININGSLFVGEGSTFQTGDFNHSVKGNFENNGTFISEPGHTVTFNGIESQAIVGTNLISFDNLIINNDTELDTNITVNNTLTLENGNLSVNDATLTINGAINKSDGFLNVSPSSSLYFGGTNALTLNDNLFSTSPIINNLSINRSQGISLGNQDLMVNGLFELNSGTLTLNNSNFTIGALGSLSIENPSSLKMIVTNDLGELRKVFTTNGTFLFPIGDNTNTAQFSPITLNINGSEYSNAYIGVKVTNSKHSNNNSATNYLNRYWSVTPQGIISCTASLTANYTTEDIAGSEENITGAQLHGEFNQESNPWLKFNFLSNNTISSGDDTVYLDQTTYFTGIDGTNPIVNILGGNTAACTDMSVSLNSDVTAEGNIVYVWSPIDYLSNPRIANPIATNVANTITYTLTVIDGNGIVGTADTTITIGNTTTWSSSWDNGEPTSTDAIIITGDYTASDNLVGCSLTISNNAVVNIPSEFNVNLYGAITINSGTLTFENNANLFQNTNVQNSGNITMNRNSSALKRLDYTLWSSPVSNQNLMSFSPLTNSNRFYSYNTTTNYYNQISTPSNTIFDTAKGYLIRMPNNHPITAAIWTGTFTGIPHNGSYTFPLAVGDEAHRFNLVGNPYPSPMNMETFANENANNITGTLYFWRKTNNASSPTYCSWTDNTFVNNGEDQVYDPNNIIRTGQGFFVEAKENANDVQFNNSQRIDNTSNQFFKTNNTIERNRIWLNAYNTTSGAFSQTAVGYVTNATNGLDSHDGKFINDGSIAFYSLVNDTKLVIQGRELPFDSNDIVTLGFTTTVADNYTISIDHLDGFFTTNTPLYLKDNYTGTFHNLNEGAYTFASTIGTFDNRFELQFTAQLGTTNPLFNANQFVIYKVNDFIKINSGSILMESVRIFDVSGREISFKNKINNTNTSVLAPDTKEVLLVQITSSDGVSVVKKIVL